MKVLLVRADGIGDALVLAPLVAALRDAGHELGAVLGTGNQNAYASSTFRYVHVLERIPWPRHGSTRASYRRTRAEIRELRYDVALIASEEPEAYRLARAGRIPIRAGFQNGWEKPFKSWWTRGQLTRALYRSASGARETNPEVETLFALGAGLHDERAPTRVLARLRPLIVEGEPPADSRIAVQLSPKFDAHGLGVRAFGEILTRLAKRHQCVALAADADRDFARAVAATCGVDVEISAGVSPWKNRIAAARALIAPDSGAAHVAGMCGTPALVLFPAGPSLARDIVRWRPWAALSRTLAIDPTGGSAFVERVDDALESLLELPAHNG